MATQLTITLTDTHTHLRVTDSTGRDEEALIPRGVTGLTSDPDYVDMVNKLDMLMWKYRIDKPKVTRPSGSGVIRPRIPD